MGNLASYIKEVVAVPPQYICAKGDYYKVGRIYKKLVGALRKALGEEVIKTLNSLGTLALIYQK